MIDFEETFIRINQLKVDKYKHLGYTERYKTMR